MKFKVLISAPYFQPVVSDFLHEFTAKNIELVIPPVNERLEEADLLQVISDIDGVICGDDRFTPKVISAAKKLKVISKWGTGIDSIDRNACEKASIAIRNTPNAFSEPVADTTLAYALNFCRNVSRMTSAMRAQEWKKINGFTLGEATFGILGVGNIGSTVARRLVPFGCRILGHDTKGISNELQLKTKIESVTLDTLLAESDFISLHTDLNPTSHHLINETNLKKVKNGAFLINTSRGPVVDEIALINALERKQLFGAALDVFEDEPLPATSPLRKFENVFLAPHNSNSSPRAWANVHRNTIKNLFEELEKHR